MTEHKKPDLFLCNCLRVNDIHNRTVVKNEQSVTQRKQYIEILADEDQTRLIASQLRKLICVHSVKVLVPSHAIRRELVLIKVKADTAVIRNEVIQIANIFRASIIDVSVSSLTIALIGDENKAEAIQNLLKEFGILELVRTGMVALERGQFTIDEQTKVKGEYDYGKNVLREGL